MSTEQKQDLREFIDLRAKILELETKNLILERTLEILIVTGHVAEGWVEKSRKLATSLI